MSQIVCTHVHAHTHHAQEGGVDNRQQKGPKGPEAQPEGLLAFLLQGEKEQKKKRAERLVDSVLEQGTQRKRQLNLKENGGDSEVL